MLSTATDTMSQPKDTCAAELKYPYDVFLQKVDWWLGASKRSEIWAYDYRAAYEKGLCPMHTARFALQQDILRKDVVRWSSRK